MCFKTFLAAFVILASSVSAQTPFHVSGCNESLWQHVYHGKFPTAEDRLNIKDSCVRVTGVVLNDLSEKDGDYHVRIKLDPQFESLLNDKNMTAQSGSLVVEPICEHAVKQRDTLEEGSCDGYEGHIFSGKMKGRHVSITGSYVEDMEHGWREIHPVTSMNVIKRTKGPTF